MNRVSRANILSMMTGILARQDKPSLLSEDSVLRDIGFRSLDFSELALRVEAESGRPLEFSGTALRGIQTVGDVLDFLEAAVGGDS
jgi:acyl carrier protein